MFQRNTFVFIRDFTNHIPNRFVIVFWNWYYIKSGLLFRVLSEELVNCNRVEVLIFVYLVLFLLNWIFGVLSGYFSFNWQWSIFWCFFICAWYKRFLLNFYVYWLVLLVFMAFFLLSWALDSHFGIVLLYLY